MSRAAIRYAKAVLQFATKANATEVVFDDMQTVHNTVIASKELRLMLKSPVVKNEAKKKALLTIFSDVSETTKNLISLVVDNKRADIMDSVAASYIDLYNETKGVKVAYVTTAVALSRELKQSVLVKVKEMTGSESVTIESTVDASIIGGFVLRVGDLQYNSSIASKFGNLKREFSKSV